MAAAPLKRVLGIQVAWQEIHDAGDAIALYSSEMFISVPPVLPVAALALLPALWLLRQPRFHVRRRRADLGLCIHCGYDLRASAGRCPECGAAPASAGAVGG